MKQLHIEDLHPLALGSALYGTGGGGDPYIGRLLAGETMRQHGPVQLLDLADMDDAQWVVSIAMAGAPTVLLEKLCDTDTFVRALRKLEAAMGRQAQAIFSAEVGGLNSVIPLSVASKLGLPLIDCDTMGRAFPQLQMTLATLAGLDIGPVALADERGNELFIAAADNAWMEKFVRTSLIQMGGAVHMALLPMRVADLRRACVPGSISQALRTGQALLEARARHSDPLQALAQTTGGQVLFTGKVVGLQREVKGGWTLGQAEVEGLQSSAGRRAQLHYQNEFLMLQVDGRTVCSTPDLIAAVELDTGEPVTGEQMAYGFRIALLGIPCVPAWQTPQAIALVGPRQFGYEVDYQPLTLKT